MPEQEKESTGVDAGWVAARLSMQRNSDRADTCRSSQPVTPAPGPGRHRGQDVRELLRDAGSGRPVGDEEIRGLLADGYRRLSNTDLVSGPQAIAHNYMVMQRAIDDRSALTLEALDQALLNVAAARVSCEQRWGCNPYAEVQDRWQSVFERLRAERVGPEQASPSAGESSRAGQNAPSGEEIRDALVAVMDDYEAEFVALGAGGRPAGYLDWPWASGYESIAHARGQRLRRQRAATIDDVAEVRAWLAAGAAVRTETDGFDILADSRARWLARLDSLVAPPDGKEAEAAPSRSLSERIRGARDQAGLSIREVARACQVNPSTPFRWEHGAAVPEVRHRRAMAQLFNLPMSYFTPDLKESDAERV